MRSARQKLLAAFLCTAWACICLPVCGDLPRIRHRHRPAFRLRYPRPVIVQPTAKHTATIIVIHGLGQNGQAWDFWPPKYSAVLPHVKWVLPTARIKANPSNVKERVPAWYIIQQWGTVPLPIGGEDETALRQSTEYLQGLINAEVAAGVPAERVLLTGFSQGGAMAFLLLRGNTTLAGVVALSTYLPLAHVRPLISEQNQRSPVLMCHGDADDVVPLSMAEQSLELLKGAGANITLRTYPKLAHYISDDEMLDVEKFWLSSLPVDYNNEVKLR